MAEQKRAPEVLWRPQNAGATPMDRYRTHVNDKFGQDLRTTRDLQRWSVRQPQNFVSVVYQSSLLQSGIFGRKPVLTLYHWRSVVRFVRVS